MQIHTNSHYGILRADTRALRNRALVSLLRRAAKHVRQYLRTRRDRRHLESLPDYLLEDIGLTRADVKTFGRS